MYRAKQETSAQTAKRRLVYVLARDRFMTRCPLSEESRRAWAARLVAYEERNP